MRNSIGVSGGNSGGYKKNKAQKNSNADSTGDNSYFKLKYFKE